ncbi:agmatinase family protein [Planctomycetota bacterium]
MTFDREGRTVSGSGLYAAEVDAAHAACVVIPVPFEATVSYRPGTARGPEAICRASQQVDLLDMDVGAVHEAGVGMETADPEIVRVGGEARSAAVRVLAALTADRTPDPADYAVVDSAGALVSSQTRKRVAAVLGDGRLPVVLGGDHSVSLGSLTACAAELGRASLGVLQIDAHADLRETYQGFRWSHASVMCNALQSIPSLRLHQVGVRDFCVEELERARTDERVTTWFDRQLRKARLAGRFPEAAHAIAEALPRNVYVSLDIDGLDPACCPNTGTPVPGGLSFDEAVCVLEAVVRSGRRIVGADLTEVSPGPLCDDSELDGWDAIVGARLLYKLIGFALRSRGRLPAAGPELAAGP